MCYSEEIKNAIIEASRVVGRQIDESDFYIEYQPEGHTPKALPQGKMAVYTFVCNGCFLKIGQANAKSKARYQSQHYLANSTRSTLAKSLLGDPEMSLIVNEGNVAQWIKDNCKRYDVIIDEKYGKNALDFIEGMLHYMYNPKYEGRTRRRRDKNYFC